LPYFHPSLNKPLNGIVTTLASIPEAKEVVIPKWVRQVGDFEEMD